MAKTTDEVAIAIFPIVVAIACAGGVRAMDVRPMDTSSTGSLAADYQKRFFMKVAVAQLPALVGVFLALVTSTHMSSIITGAVLSVFLFAWTGPTDRNIERDQRRIRAAGSSLDLKAALMTRSQRP